MSLLGNTKAVIQNIQKRKKETSGPFAIFGKKDNMAEDMTVNQKN